MVEQRGCVYCIRWHADVGPEYPITPEGRFAPLRVVDLRALPDDIRNTQYHHVIANPPYFERDKGSAAPDAGRDVAMGGDTPLADWLDIAAKRLAPKGYFTLILRIERLPEVLSHLRLGSIIVRPIAARLGQDPHLFLLQARHSARAPFQLKSHLIMHDGTMHDADRENYTDMVGSILRNGDALHIAD